jgi:hypothetical protein
MNFKISYQVRSIILTLLLLVAFNIFSTVFFSGAAYFDFRIGLHVLIVLFLAFKMNINTLPFLIFIVEYVHSIFSIEGWAIGTLAGLIISIIVNYLKDMIQFTSAISIMFIVQIFQLAWFLIVGAIFGLKMGNIDFYTNTFRYFIYESFFLSLMAPIVFKILSIVWGSEKLGDSVEV